MSDSGTDKSFKENIFYLIVFDRTDQIFQISRSWFRIRRNTHDRYLLQTIIFSQMTKGGMSRDKQLLRCFSRQLCQTLVKLQQFFLIGFAVLFINSSMFRISLHQSSRYCSNFQYSFSRTQPDMRIYMSSFFVKQPFAGLHTGYLLVLYSF